MLILAKPPHPELLPVLGQRLGELAAVADDGALPVEHVDGHDDDDTQPRQNGARVLDRVAVDVGVHGGGVHGRDTRQEITRERVAAAGRRRVDAVCGDHVVDR